MLIFRVHVFSSDFFFQFLFVCDSTGFIHFNLLFIIRQSDSNPFFSFAQNCSNPTVSHSVGAVDNSGVCLYKEPMVAIHFFLVAFFMRHDTGDAKSHDETSVRNYTKVSVCVCCVLI